MGACGSTDAGAAQLAAHEDNTSSDSSKTGKQSEPVPGASSPSMESVAEADGAGAAAAAASASASASTSAQSPSPVRKQLTVGLPQTMRAPIAPSAPIIERNLHSAAAVSDKVLDTSKFGTAAIRSPDSPVDSSASSVIQMLKNNAANTNQARLIAASAASAAVAAAAFDQLLNCR